MGLEVAEGDALSGALAVGLRIVGEHAVAGGPQEERPGGAPRLAEAESVITEVTGHPPKHLGM